eukprot:5782072-Amphidinium_carterae.1
MLGEAPHPGPSGELDFCRKLMKQNTALTINSINRGSRCMIWAKFQRYDVRTKHATKCLYGLGQGLLRGRSGAPLPVPDRWVVHLCLVPLLTAY